MKTKIPDAVLAAEVSRRGLVKTTAIGGLAMASSALTLPFSRIAHAVDSAIPTKSDEKVIWSACTVNCGDAPRDKCAHFREINGIAAAFQHLQKNYIPAALSFL